MIKTAPILPFLGLFVYAHGCGQEDVVFPDSGTGCIECGCDASIEDGGAYYPPGPYEIGVGKTFPKVSWNARLNGEDAVFASEEAYAQRFEKRALVLLISARRCPECEKQIIAIGQRIAQYDAVAVMLGVAFKDLGPEGGELSLDDAEDLLVNEDKWPPIWPVTNEHKGLPSQFEEGFPHTIAVSLCNMKVIKACNDEYLGDQGADSLLQDISNFADCEKAK